MRYPDLTVERKISVNGGEYRDWHDCTDEEKQMYSQAVANALIKHFEYAVNNDESVRRVVIDYAKQYRSDWLKKGCEKNETG